MNLKEYLKKDWLIISALIVTLIINIIAYSAMKDTIPLHWNFKGEIDSYGSKNTYLMIALLPIGIYLLMLITPLLDPKKETYKKVSYGKIRFIVVILMIILNLLITYATINENVNISLMMCIILCLFIAALGNFMPTISQNYFVGVKLPWTLNNKENWDKTHRFTGKVWTVTGILCIFICFISIPFAIIILITCTVVIPLVYSFLLFKKMENKK